MIEKIVTVFFLFSMPILFFILPFLLMLFLFILKKANGMIKIISFIMAGKNFI
jgi:hypothetical protein